jgi:hypothetical protein
MNSQNPSAVAFVACGRFLFGAHYKAPLADALSLRADTVDAMGKGRTRIPEGVWLEVAGLIQDREKDLPLLKLKALKFANEQLARTYRVDGSAEFEVRPAPDGRWYTIEYSTTWPMDYRWENLPDDKRILPANTAAIRLELDGVRGGPTSTFTGGAISYPASRATINAAGSLPAGTG